MAYSKDFNKSLDDEGDKISRINAAGLINSILERLWSESYSAMGSGNYLKWNCKLDAIWTILGGDCVENGEEDKEITKINLSIYEKGNLKSVANKGFEQNINNNNNAVQYQLLLKKSLFLRRLQNKQGKGTAYETDDQYDFD